MFYQFYICLTLVLHALCCHREQFTTITIERCLISPGGQYSGSGTPARVIAGHCQQTIEQLRWFQCSTNQLMYLKLLHALLLVTFSDAAAQEAESGNPQYGHYKFTNTDVHIFCYCQENRFMFFGTWDALVCGKLVNLFHPQWNYWTEVKPER